jgi:hypothetical protein
LWFWYICIVRHAAQQQHALAFHLPTDTLQCHHGMPTSTSAKSSVNTMLMQSKDPCVVVAPRATTRGGGSGLWAPELIVVRIGILRTVKPLRNSRGFQFSASSLIVYKRCLQQYIVGCSDNTKQARSLH